MKKKRDIKGRGEMNKIAHSQSIILNSCSELTKLQEGSAFAQMNSTRYESKVVRPVNFEHSMSIAKERSLKLLHNPSN